MCNISYLHHAHVIMCVCVRASVYILFLSYPCCIPAPFFQNFPYYHVHIILVSMSLLHILQYKINVSELTIQEYILLTEVRKFPETLGIKLNL